MTCMREEARMLVSVLAEEDSDTNILAGLSWLLPPQQDQTTEHQADSDDEWALKEVRWAQHADILSRLVRLANYWVSLEQKPVLSTPMSSEQPIPLSTSDSGNTFLESAPTLPCITAPTSAIPTPTVHLNCRCSANMSMHSHLSLVDVLCSLSGQLELFYTVSHVYLQSLRYYCFFTLSPDMRRSVLHSIDEVYENLVLGVMKCFQVTHCLKVAHTTHPDTFLARCVSHLPTIFTITDDDYKESSMNYPSIFRRENDKCSKKEGNSAKRPRDDALDKVAYAILRRVRFVGRMRGMAFIVVNATAVNWSMKPHRCKSTSLLRTGLVWDIEGAFTSHKQHL
ncbi:uncharacterized protein [Panulirus ornatus]|uniref:uncharacterized protein n=1 Tax=Panulirus ornatus TaxID=150431 RepID=UPI003A8B5182